jgi:hypothetical protein
MKKIFLILLFAFIAVVIANTYREAKEEWKLCNGKKTMSVRGGTMTPARISEEKKYFSAPAAPEQTTLMRSELVDTSTGVELSTHIKWLNLIGIAVIVGLVDSWPFLIACLGALTAIQLFRVALARSSKRKPNPLKDFAGHPAH